MSPDKPIEDKPTATGLEDVDDATNVQRDLHRSLCMWLGMWTDAGKPGVEAAYKLKASQASPDKPTEIEPLFDSTPGIDSTIVRMMNNSGDVKDVSLLTLLFLKGWFNSRERQWRAELATLREDLDTAQAEILSLRSRVNSFSHLDGDK